LGLALGAGAAGAQPLIDTGGGAPLSITADQVEFEQRLNVYVARGNVRIEQEDGATLTADWVAFSNATRHGLASGNVVVVDEDDTLYADFLQFNVDSLQGVVYQGQLENTRTGFRMEGAEVRKTEEQTYVFKDGVFTTCRCPEEGRDPWSLKAKQADLKVGGWATARNSTVNVLGVPVFWIPYMVYPLRNDRQTGFLFPTLRNSSRNGWEAGVPFFWAAHPQVNVLTTPVYSTKRGPLAKLDVDYVLGDTGRLDGGRLVSVVVPDDQDVEPDSAATPFGTTRWGAELTHTQEFPWDLDFRVLASMVSDNQFPFDIPELGHYRNDRYLPSVASLSKRFGEFGPFAAWTAVHWADDLQAPDDEDRDAYLLQRLPEAMLSQSAHPFPWAERLITSFDVQYIDFWRRQDPLDELPGSVVVDDTFLDTGIDALPDGLERNEDGDIVTTDAEILQRDGGVITAQEVLAQMLAQDPTLDPLATLDELLAGRFNPDQSMDDAPTGPEGDGAFQEGEPLADKGHRVLVNPRLAAPFRLGDTLEVFPELGYHGTFYQTTLQGFSQRNIVTGRLDLRSRLRKVLDLPFGMGAADHLVEPRFSYVALQNVGASDDTNPLFIPRPLVTQQRLRQFEIDNVLRDPADRIDDFNGFQLGVSNRFYTIEPEPEPGEEAGPSQAEPEEEAGPLQGEPEEGRGTGRRRRDEREDKLWVASKLLADFSAGFAYNFLDSQPGWFVMDGSVYPVENVRVNFNLGYDLEGTQLEEALFGAGWGTPTGHNLTVRYRYLRQIPQFFEDFQRSDARFEDFEAGLNSINQVELFGRWAVTRSWALLWSFRYSIDQTLLLTNQGGVEYLSKCKCWAVRLTAANERSRGLQFGFEYILLGLGDDTVRPFSNR